MGNAVFHKHVGLHGKEHNQDNDPLIFMSKEHRKTFRRGSCHGRYLGSEAAKILSAQTCDGRIFGGIGESWQCYAPSVRIDVSEAFPCGNTVHTRLLELNDELHKEFNHTLPSILEVGAGFISDGVYVTVSNYKQMGGNIKISLLTIFNFLADLSRRDGF